ncbi:hypothetical protein PF006_g6470 [Phytophthora fragariae]|uniref:Uncharacterized protein n=1 Tax=Phytophthora fragariae TaxID=53985 RepID=A0A6A3EL61_9STRA|nr:hypothetical protein PF009_g15795 [Phytophthora fragariae]KAE9148997.1 hypothetical protein PF006_g6470 [Phytophthora fragariae]
MKAECVTLETATLEAPPRRENIVTTRLGVRVGLKSPLPSRGATSPMAWRGFSSSLAGALVLPVEALGARSRNNWKGEAPRADCTAVGRLTRGFGSSPLTGYLSPLSHLEAPLSSRPIVSLVSAVIVSRRPYFSSELEF